MPVPNTNVIAIYGYHTKLMSMDSVLAPLTLFPIIPFVNTHSKFPPPSVVLSVAVVNCRQLPSRSACGPWTGE